MKRFVLAMALVLVITVPAFAQNYVGPVDPEVQNDSLLVNASFGPVKMKPLMIYTTDGSNIIAARFYPDEIIRTVSYWEVKGTGNMRIKLEVRDSAGNLIYRYKWPDPLEVNNDVFAQWIANFQVSPDPPITPGYYTAKFIYTDVATGNTWSHQTKIHVLPPL
jgi:hypothetical protein